MEPVRMAAGWLQSSIKGLELMLGIAAIKLFESRKWFLSNKKSADRYAKIYGRSLGFERLPIDYSLSNSCGKRGSSLIDNAIMLI
jgi:hypothetical protein